MSEIANVQIKVTTEVLKAKADEVSKKISNMRSYFEEVENVITGTNGYWIGEAGDLHRKLYNDQKDKIEEIFKRLEEHPKDLVAIALNYEDVETRVEELSKALPGDIIE